MIVLKELRAKIEEALISALPITAIVYLMALLPFFDFDMSQAELLTFTIGAVLLVIGIGLFNMGADLAMTPMGAHVGSGLSRQKKLTLLLSVCFILGMLITIAEPDLQVLAKQVSAVMNGTVNLGDYKVVDLILGVEKQGDKGSYLGYNRPYKTFPLQLQEKIASFCNNGGSLFVSGAFLASDMTKNSQDHNFIKNVLHVDYGGSVTDLSENIITGSGLCMNFRRGANEECYAVSRPDILVPVDNAFVSFVFDGSKQSAGVAYAGDYRVISTSFPFESVTDSELRSKLMGAVMRFLMR